MFRPRIIPVLLLKGNSLVKTVRFNKSKATYIGDPINAVRIFNELDADELIILDILASRESRCFPLELVRNIGDESFMPFAVGGGIKTVNDIHNILINGAEKVILNTAIYTNPGLIHEASVRFGSQSIVMSLDIKKDWKGKYKLFGFDGQKKMPVEPLEIIRRADSMGAGEIMLNFMDRDGMMDGYDIAFTRFLSEYTNVPVILCGGAGNLNHMQQAYKQTNVSALAAGSMFIYHGSRKGVLINYPEKNEIIKTFTE
jgi:imidazole glycerol-phosphate synthase subunit HisF